MAIIKLKWTPRYIGAQQLVYRSTSPIDISAPPAALATIAADAAEYEDSTAANNTTYYYVVGTENEQSPADIAFSNQVVV